MVVDLTNVPVALAIGGSGIVLGGGPGCPDDSGVWWKWSSDSAMGDGADTREVTGDNANRNGLYDATTFLGGQMPLIRGSARATSLAALFDAERRLRALVTVAYRDFTLTVPGFTGVMSARRQGRFQWTPLATSSGYAYAQFSFTLFCPDPYIATASPMTFSLAFPVAGGLDWSDPGVDWSDPGADWSSSDSAASATLVNDGPTAVPLLLTLGAPITTATFTLQQGSSTQVQTLTNTDTPGADLLTTGQVLVVDNATGSVKLNGSGRNSWLTGDLLMVPPGTSTIYLTGIGTGPVTGSFSSVRP